MTTTDEITSINEVIDADGTVGWFEIDKTHEGQNEPFRIVMNSYENPELAEVHQWYRDNDKPIPDYSSYPIEPEE